MRKVVRWCSITSEHLRGQGGSVRVLVRKKEQGRRKIVEDS